MKSNAKKYLAANQPSAQNKVTKTRNISLIVVNAPPAG
jgi:hypothetical protein